MTSTRPIAVTVFLFAQVLCLCLVLISPHCIAEQDLPKVAEKYLEKQMTFAIGMGGTSLSSVTGGQDYDIRAGSGFTLTGGYIAPIFRSDSLVLEAHLGIGVMVVSDDQERKKEVTWLRFPIESIFFVQNGCCFRYGVGPIYHFGNRINAAREISSADMSVENALGWALATDFGGKSGLRGKSVRFGLRYNNIRYVSSSFSAPADGSSLSLYATVGFGDL